MSHNDFEENDILMYCALRFDGYAYEAMRNHEGSRWSFLAVTEELENTMLFPEDDLECLAAFFAMQRYLGKWGGEYLTRVSREHILYRLLFLHCYRMEIPVGLRTHDWYPKWERVYRAEREHCAAIIRQKMGRRIVGPEQSLAPSLFDRQEGN